MFIGFEKSFSSERVGWVADFCPFCRNLRSLTVLRTEHQLSFHFFLIPFWRNKSSGYVAFCQECKVLREVNPGRYEELSPEPLEPEGLVKALTQEALEELTGRSGLEERFQQKTLTPEDRMKLIAEPLRALEPYFGGGLTDQPMSLPSIIAILSIFGALFLQEFRHPSIPGFSRDATHVTLIALAIALTILSLRRDVRENSRRAICPLLAPLFSSLKPERHELEQVIRQLQAENRKAGEYLNVDRLYGDLLRAYRDPGK